MNQKLEHANIKLNVCIPDKEFLFNLQNRGNEDWSSIEVEFNHFT